MTGGNGLLSLDSTGTIIDSTGNFLIRSANLFLQHGLNVMMADALPAHPGGLSQGIRLSPTHAAELQGFINAAMTRWGLPVWVVGIDLMQRRIHNGDFAIDGFFDAVRKATERAASLTHRLLAFARQQPLSPEVIDANRMIANISDLLRSTLGGHIRIETVSAAGLWNTRADLHQLENAVLNIAINSRDAMPEGGKLTIETANAYLDDAYCQQHAEVDPGQFVMIAISDTGCGMVSRLEIQANCRGRADAAAEAAGPQPRRPLPPRAARVE